MRYLSVCSGIEAATVAWPDWTPFAFSEIDAFPSAVLAHHYPDVPNLGDMNDYTNWPDASLDVLVGGTPCQSFSIAGLRKGMADPRGNLALVYLATANRYRPRWLIWENVPGVLSSNKGRDFGALLGGLERLGYGWAYRTLDAIDYGLPCPRPRVFVVGHSGGWQRAASVLFERSCFERDSAPVTEKEAISAAPVLTSRGGMAFDDRTPCILEADGPRIATPLEWERALGFPDNYTRIPYRKKSADNCPDGPRYKALGNSMAVPVMRWIGERINQVERIDEK